MFISTVIAVALGIAPVTTSPQAVSGDYSNRVGTYTQSVDRRGTTHLKGMDRNGIPYELTMDRRGNVEATFGERVINFQVREIA